MLAFNADLYDLFKYIHVVGAVIWVGAGAFFQYYATRLTRASDTQKLAGFAKDIEKAGMQLAMPSSLFVLAAGIVMVAYSPAIAFRDLWILVGLLGYAATFSSPARSSSDRSPAGSGRRSTRRVRTTLRSRR